MTENLQQEMERIPWTFVFLEIVSFHLRIVVSDGIRNVITSKQETWKEGRLRSGAQMLWTTRIQKAFTRLAKWAEVVAQGVISKRNGLKPQSCQRVLF